MNTFLCDRSTRGVAAVVNLRYRDLMIGEPKRPRERPLDVKHFENLLSTLEKLVEADLIAWDVRSATKARQRLDRLTSALADVVVKIRMPSNL